MINDSVFSKNRALTGRGGAIFTNFSGTTTLYGTEVDGNMASVVGGGGGLMVEGDGSRLELYSSTVSNNAAVITVSNSAVRDRYTTVSCTGGPLGQTFVADTDTLSAFQFDIRLDGSVDDLNVIPDDLNIIGQVRVVDDPLVSPDGSIIATASAFAPGGVWPGGSTQTLTFNLEPVVTLVPGNTYAIETFIAGAYSLFKSSGENADPAVDDFSPGERYDVL